VPFDGETIFLANLFDEEEAQANTEKLQQEIAELEQQVAGFKDRLSNENYVTNAPENVVQETRDMLKQAEQDLEIARCALKS